MLAAVLEVPRPGHVLGVLDGLAFGILHGHQHVAGSGFAHVRNREPAFDVVGVERLQAARFVADVHQSDGFGRAGARVQFDELMVVDFEERFGGPVPLLHLKELVEPQLVVEGARGREIRDAEGDVSDSALVRRLRPQE